MKGKITKRGDFYIERPGKMVVQICPFALDEYRGHTTCGDWCPLFGEPERHPKYTYLILCHRMIEFAEFTDERVGGEE